MELIGECSHCGEFVSSSQKGVSNDLFGDVWHAELGSGMRFDSSRVQLVPGHLEHLGAGTLTKACKLEGNDHLDIRQVGPLVLW